MYTDSEETVKCPRCGAETVVPLMSYAERERLRCACGASLFEELMAQEAAMFGSNRQAVMRVLALAGYKRK